jgi:hypothetical protein
MTLPEMMSWLQHREFSTAIAESTWMFPAFESVHVLALTLVVGFVAMMDLRLLGVGRERPASEVLETTLPWVWGSFALAFVMGALLFCSKAVTYYDNIPFRIKMLAMVLAGINMLVFHVVTARSMSQWDKGLPPLTARIAGGVSIGLWVVIVAMGRYIGFTY